MINIAKSYNINQRRCIIKASFYNGNSYLDIERSGQKLGYIVSKWPDLTSVHSALAHSKAVLEYIFFLHLCMDLLLWMIVLNYSVQLGWSQNWLNISEMHKKSSLQICWLHVPTSFRWETSSNHTFTYMLCSWQGMFVLIRCGWFSVQVKCRFQQLKKKDFCFCLRNYTSDICLSAYVK